MFSRRSLILIPNLVNFKRIQRKPTLPAIYKNEFKSDTRDFKITTLIKDDDKSVAIHQIVEWYDPLTMEHKTKESSDIYFLEGDFL